MRTQAAGRFKVTDWQTNPYQEFDGGAKLSKESVKKTFSGDFVGSSTLEYLMYYGLDGSASFVGQEHLEGSLHGLTGSFVLQHSGVDREGKTAIDYFVIPGSGGGELRGLQGKGSVVLSGHAEDYPFELFYEIEE